MIARRLSVAGALFVAACATTRIPARDVPPVSVAFPLGIDSTRSIVLGALRSAEMPVDANGGDPAIRRITSTYSVRRGGIGESSIRVRLAIEPESDAATVVLIDAVATDRGRSLSVGGDRNAPVQRPSTHAVGAEDLEALRPVQRLLRQLESAGGQVSKTP